MTSIPAGLYSRVERIVVETGFCGVVHIGYLEERPWVRAFGLAERAHGEANTPETQFAIASGTKTLTALAVMSLIAEGRLALDSEVQGVLGGSSDIVPHGVTVRQLLAHTSGIGDYLDEAAIADIESYALDVPGDKLEAPADYLVLLRGRQPKFPPGISFAYCNSGYVLLAYLVEVVTGRNYYDLVQERVCGPAGMSTTRFCRLDELPRSAAVGYLPSKGWSTNHDQLPVRGAGDGGAYATAGDITALWSALVNGRIVPLSLVSEMLRPQHESGSARHAYGLGFWLSRDRQAVFMEGSDAGISFRSTFELSTGLVCSVMSNTTRGAWPVVKELEIALSEVASDPGAGTKLMP